MSLRCWGSSPGGKVLTFLLQAMNMIIVSDNEVDGYTNLNNGNNDENCNSGVQVTRLFAWMRGLLGNRQDQEC